MTAITKAAKIISPGQHETLRRRIRSVKRRANAILLRLAIRNRVAAAFYYAFVNHELLREARAVGAGQLRYAADHKAEAASYYLLRRNIHRLEKGLIMRPRRRTFATDFLGETVDIFKQARRGSGGWNSELAWAEDVLIDYFQAVDLEHPKIASAYAKFVALGAPASGNSGGARAIPYVRDLSEPPPVDLEDLMKLAKRRRSVRWFLEKPVDRSLVDKALEVAAQSPSACNRQPFHFRIFDDPDLARAITAIPMGTKGFSDQVPAVAVVVGQLRAYPFERDRHVIYIDGSLAAMTFMFALEAMGLASCPINWPDQEPHESEMKAALQLADDERVVMLIAFGWPDPEGKVAYSSKRAVADLRRFN
jgi:nitroreductase